MNNLYDEYSMDGVENLIDFFDVEETAKTIENNILKDQYSLGTVVDYYRPYYVKYKLLNVDIDTGMTESVVSECRQKARTIALMFIDAICKKFRLYVDEFWIDNLPDEELQGFTLVLYDFFILHFKEFLLEVLTRYIDGNADTLASAFETAAKSAKDAAFCSLQKMIPYNYAVVGANVYDACFIILSSLDEHSFFDYIDADNEIQPIILKYFDDGRISGNFVDVIEEMMQSTNVSLKGYIGFEIIAHLKNSYSNRDSTET